MERERKKLDVSNPDILPKNTIPIGLQNCNSSTSESCKNPGLIPLINRAGNFYSTEEHSNKISDLRSSGFPSCSNYKCTIRNVNEKSCSMLDERELSVNERNPCNLLCGTELPVERSLSRVMPDLRELPVQISEIGDRK